MHNSRQIYIFLKNPKIPCPRVQESVFLKKCSVYLHFPWTGTPHSACPIPVHPVHHYRPLPLPTRRPSLSPSDAILALRWFLMAFSIVAGTFERPSFLPCWRNAIKPGRGPIAEHRSFPAPQIPMPTPHGLLEHLVKRTSLISPLGPIDLLIFVRLEFRFCVSMCSGNIIAASTVCPSSRQTGRPHRKITIGGLAKTER
jgi:hypothetical protein